MVDSNTADNAAGSILRAAGRGRALDTALDRLRKVVGRDDRRAL